MRRIGRYGRDSTIAIGKRLAIHDCLGATGDHQMQFALIRMDVGFQRTAGIDAHQMLAEGAAAQCAGEQRLHGDASKTGMRRPLGSGAGSGENGKRRHGLS